MLASPIRNSFYSLLLALLALLQPRAAQAQVAPRITIDTSPPGATIFVDGSMQSEKTGPTTKVRIPKGQHKLRLELEGHRPIEQTVTIAGAQKFVFPFEKAPARLDIKYPATNDAARGAEIFVDGQPAGSVPQLVDLPAGRHLVEVRKPGMKVYTETVEVKSAETRPVWVIMASDVKTGGLIISADAAADVVVDGQPKGQAPVVVENLTEGEHVVEVRRAEPGSPPWRQNVRVVGGQQTKVIATTAPPPPAAGTLMVVTGVSDAEIQVDGISKGGPGQPISLAPGQHSITVKAKGHKPVTKVVEIEAGKPRVERVEMEGDAMTRKVGTVRIVMANPIDGAQYYVNGRRYDETAALADQGIEVSSGKVIVVVKKDGFGQDSKEVVLAPGSTEVVTLNLRNVGKLYIASEPKGAFVMLDRVLVGQTPMTRENVSQGPHTVEFQMPGYESKIEQTNVLSGDTAQVSVMLTKVKEKEEDPKEVRRGLSSFSAVTNKFGSFTADIGSGYPWIGNGRLTVGVWKAKNNVLGEIGLDIGAEFRSNFYTDHEAAGTIRFQAMRKGPFALGLHMLVGGGGGPRGRNSFSWELGVPVTILAGNKVKLTGKVYLQVYSDRNCPAADSLSTLYKNDPNEFKRMGDPIAGAEHTGDRCVGRSYDANTGFPSAIYAVESYNGTRKYDKNLPDFQVDGTGVLERFTEVRGMLQAAIELALTSQVNLYGILEGAPGQKERHMFTDKFNRIFPIHDTPIYGRLGLTAKF
ncbi:MAG TPA: PEGA domain-containing protein [Pseudomonadota bacterium]|nr:PEGA domain-containing protein [Pseudomonadota bacterium]